MGFRETNLKTTPIALNSLLLFRRVWGVGGLSRGITRTIPLLRGSP